MVVRAPTRVGVAKRGTFPIASKLVEQLYLLMSLPVLHVRNEVPLGPTGTCRQGQ